MYQLRCHPKSNSGVFCRNFEKKQDMEKAIKSFEKKAPRIIHFDDVAGNARVVLDQEDILCVSVDLDNKLLGEEN